MINDINFNHIYFEFYIFAFVLAILFGILSNIKTNQLIGIIIILLLSVAVYLYLDKQSSSKDIDLKYKENALDNDIQERKETNEKIFYIDKFPKKVKYLKESSELMDIVTNLRFTLRFNKTRYTDIILNMNKLMKVYIYILSDRYDPVQYIPIFTDIRDNIIEIMYSLFVVVPHRLKHIYGLSPNDEIYKSTYDFMQHSRQMLNILEKYAIIHNGAVYVPDSKYKPSNGLTSLFP